MMSDFFANGAQIPNIATNAEVENAENANFLRMFFRNNVLIARRNTGAEIQLSQREPLFGVRGVQTGRLIVVAEQLVLPSSGTLTYTFPIPFPTNPIVTVSAARSNETTPTVAEVVSLTNTAITVRASRNNIRVSAVLLLIAFGIEAN